MPVTLKQLADQVGAKFQDGEQTTITAIVQATVEGLGMSIDARTGEVVDPRPATNTYHEQMKAQNVHWSGGRRNRRR